MASASPPPPLLKRIRMSTVAALDLSASERLYGEWLGYEVRERGFVSDALAASWDAPALAGRAMMLMSSPGAPDVHIRFVESDPVPGYRAMTTLGWNSIEIIVDDVAALGETLAGSPFAILDTPHPLKGYPSIVAMQVKGPSEEVLYLTMESGDRAASILPEPGAPVGRPFIAVVAGLDMDAMLGWYARHFRLAARRVSQSPIGILQTAQGLDSDHLFTLSTMALAEHGNLIEYDVYPPTAGPRPRLAGQLPPGNAMYSFTVDRLDAIDLPFIAPPIRPAGIGYDGGKAAVVRGPSGELIELIEG